jgi:hypothetical protein
MIRDPFGLDFTVVNLVEGSVSDAAEDCIHQINPVYSEFFVVDSDAIADIVGLFRENEIARRQELRYGSLKCEAYTRECCPEWS